MSCTIYSGVTKCKLFQNRQFTTTHVEWPCVETCPSIVFCPDRERNAVRGTFGADCGWSSGTSTTEARRSSALRGYADDNTLDRRGPRWPVGRRWSSARKCDRPPRIAPCASRDSCTSPDPPPGVASSGDWWAPMTSFPSTSAAAWRPSAPALRSVFEQTSLPSTVCCHSNNYCNIIDLFWI